MSGTATDAPPNSQVYLEFSSAQSAGDYKRQLSGLERSDQLSRAHAAYHEGSNPFKTLPKDGVQRQTRDGPGRGGSSSTYHNSGPVNNFQNSGGMAATGGYQGNNNNYRGRGGYRGGMRGVGGGMGGGGYNQGYGNQNSMNHTYNNNNMGGGGFNAMGGGGFRGGFVPRGGAPNYRGRGGPMMGGGVGGNPMMGAQMGMGGMMPMNMMGGMGGMGMGKCLPWLRSMYDRWLTTSFHFTQASTTCQVNSRPPSLAIRAAPAALVATREVLAVLLATIREMTGVVTLTAPSDLVASELATAS